MECCGKQEVSFGILPDGKELLFCLVCGKSSSHPEQAEEYRKDKMMKIKIIPGTSPCERNGML